MTDRFCHRGIPNPPKFLLILFQILLNTQKLRRQIANNQVSKLDLSSYKFSVSFNNEYVNSSLLYQETILHLLIALFVLSRHIAKNVY